MNRRKVFVAIPTLTGELADATEAALKWIHLESAGLDWDLEVFRWVGDSIIHHARDVCAAKFLASEAQDIFWLDSDVGFGPGVFTRLMTHPVDFVAGMYRVKAEPERYAMHYLPEPVLKSDPLTGLLEVSSVPFGCVRIARKAMEQMRDAHEDRWFTAACAGIKAWPMFDTEIKDHVFWGEDFYFCRRYRELGGKVWIDPELRLQHVGRPDAQGNPVRYSGKIGDWIRANTEAA